MLLTLLNPFAAKAAPIDGPAALEMVRSRSAILVDVREPSELSQGLRAKGAINVPLGTLKQRADPEAPSCEPALRGDQAVILICASGARSGMAGKVMCGLGHKEVYDLGAIEAWRAAGGDMAP